MEKAIRQEVHVAPLPTGSFPKHMWHCIILHVHVQYTYVLYMYTGIHSGTGHVPRLVQCTYRVK